MKQGKLCLASVCRVGGWLDTLCMTYLQIYVFTKSVRQICIVFELEEQTDFFFLPLLLEEISSFNAKTTI